MWLIYKEKQINHYYKIKEDIIYTREKEEYDQEVHRNIKFSHIVLYLKLDRRYIVLYYYT